MRNFIAKSGAPWRGRADAFVTRSQPSSGASALCDGRVSRTLKEDLCRKVFSETVLCERWRLVGESAGISRHGEGDENALRRRSSYPRRPRVMRWRSVRAQRSVDRGRAGGAIEPRNSSSSGCRRSANRRKAILLAAFSRVAGGPCAVEEPRHARRAPCARSGRSRGRPWVLMMPRPGWFAGWQIDAWRAVRGTLRR